MANISAKQANFSAISFDFSANKDYALKPWWGSEYTQNVFTILPLIQNVTGWLVSAWGGGNPLPADPGSSIVMDCNTEVVE